MLGLSALQNLELQLAQFPKINKDGCMLFSAASGDWDSVFYHLQMHFDFGGDSCRVSIECLSILQKYGPIFLEEVFFILMILFFSTWMVSKSYEVVQSYEHFSFKFIAKFHPVFNLYYQTKYQTFLKRRIYQEEGN